MKTFKEIYEAKRATQKDALRAFLKDPRNDKKRAAEQSISELSNPRIS